MSAENQSNFGLQNYIGALRVIHEVSEKTIFILGEEAVGQAEAITLQAGETDPQKVIKEAEKITRQTGKLDPVSVVRAAEQITGLHGSWLSRNIIKDAEQFTIYDAEVTRLGEDLTHAEYDALGEPMDETDEDLAAGIDFKIRTDAERNKAKSQLKKKSDGSKPDNNEPPAIA